MLSKIPPTRRQFLTSASSFGIGGVALAWMLQSDPLQGAPVKPSLERPKYDLLPKKPAHPPRAKAMISMFMQGGPSQIDLLDPKPGMAKYDGQPFPGEIKYDNAAEASSKVLHSPWKFEPRGASGTEAS